MVNFFYEDYPFEKGKNYLIYFRGNFGPPTKGHFSVVKAFIDNPNVYYLISQIGSERRHGVPYELSRKIWEEYIEYLLPKERILLKKLDSSLDVLKAIKSFKKYNNIEIDRVIFIRGIEWEKYENRDKEKEMNKLYSRLIKKLKNIDIGLDFCFLSRNIDVISASKFVEALKEVEDSDIEKDILKLKTYLPEGLPNMVAYRIIKSISRCKHLR